MKIGMMTTWNRPCGASVHAQLIGNEWVKEGHQLTVFAPYGMPILQKQDEPWVIRHYELNKRANFDPTPILASDYEIFVFQQIGEMPSYSLLRIAREIKKKAKLVVVIHEGKIPDYAVRKIPWDSIVCFDKRYKRFLVDVFPAKKIHILHYPCRHVKLGDRAKTRTKLGLPLDKMIVIVYGISVHHYFHLLPMMNRINKVKPLLFIVFTPIKDWAELYEAVSPRYDFVKLKMEVLSTDELYEYLWASDALIYHRDPSSDVVVASTIYVCMGAGCPIFALHSNFVETLDMEIVKYGGLDELESLLLSDRSRWDLTIRAAINYATRNSSSKIAKKFIRLFKSL